MIQGKVINRVVKILTYAGIAKPTAKLGQALGPLGLNMAQICKEMNDMSQHIREDVPIRCRLYSYKDNTYSLELFSPPSSWMIKKACGILKGSPAAGWEIFGQISLPALYEIAKIKLEMDSNLQHLNHEQVVKMLMGTCRSIGVEVVAERPPTIAISLPLRKIGQK